MNPTSFKKRFVYVASPVSSAQGGGGERFLDFFTADLRETEHIFIGSSRTVDALFRRKGYRSFLSTSGFEPVSIRNLCLLPLSYLLGLFQFLRFRKTFESADLIISPTAFSEVFFLLPWLRRIKKKCLHIVLSNKVPNAFIKTPLGKILRRSWEQDCVVFCSESTKNEWASHGLAPSNANTIYNGVLVRPFALPKLKPDMLTPIRLGFLARLHWEKGPDTLLNALALVKTSSQSIHVIIAGDGPYKTECQQLAKRLHFPSNITIEWPGLIADPIAFYESIDTLVFPSRREGFSLALLEAWERGVPVITSDIPSFLEAKQKTTALEQKLIFRKNDAADLAARIDDFIKNKNDHLSTQNRTQLHAVIENHFSLKKMMEAYQDLFHNLTQSQKTS